MSSTSTRSFPSKLEQLEHSSGPNKLLLAASTGGHLSQIVRFSDRWNISDDSLFVTFDSEQSRSLLRGKRVLHVPYVRPRDLKSTVRAYHEVVRAIGDEKFDMAISTGAALAVGALVAARRKGILCTYVESVSRLHGPSVSGRIINAIRIAEMRTQHSAWAGGRWQQHRSVLEQFSSRPRSGPQPGTPLKVFVTLGTIRPYRFDSLVDAIIGAGLATEHTVWQLGETSRDGLPGKVLRQTTADEFKAFAMDADVVITHAGVGTLLELLEWGIHPVVAPRRKHRGEHVDDHQLQIAELMASAGLAQVVTPETLSMRQLTEAASRENHPVS